MLKSLLAAAGLLVSITAMAADDLAPEIRYFRSGPYVCEEQSYPLTFDAEQQASLREFTKMQMASFKKLGGQLSTAEGKAMDPDGDLTALTDAVKVMYGDLDKVVDIGNKLYGPITHWGFNAYKMVPSGLMLVIGREWLKNELGWLRFGGSGMLGFLWVPFKYECRKPGTDIVQRGTRWDWSFIFMPSGNIGVSAGAQGGQNYRGAFGLVWGQLNKASDISGAGIGPSVTAQIAGLGVNAKVLALKTRMDSIGVNNILGLVGIEKNQGTTVPVALDMHLNLTFVIDASSMIKTALDAVSIPGNWIERNANDDNYPETHPPQRRPEFPDINFPPKPGSQFPPFQPRLPDSQGDQQQPGNPSEF